MVRHFFPPDNESADSFVKGIAVPEVSVEKVSLFSLVRVLLFVIIYGASSVPRGRVVAMFLFLAVIERIINKPVKTGLLE